MDVGGDEEEEPDEDARGPGQEEAAAPAHGEEVGAGDVDAEGVGEAVAEVDAPVEDAGSGSTVLRAEQVRDEADAEGAAGGFPAKTVEKKVFIWH